MQRAFTAICLVVVLAVCLGFGRPEIKGHMVEEVYVVQKNDTLWTVGEKFIVKNTYSRRDLREFTEGLYEANYDDVFRDREAQGWARPKEVFVGDTLRVRYWVREE